VASPENGILFAIGVGTLPFLGFSSGQVDMARVDVAVQGNLTHPTGLAEWFGICAVFFAVFGNESRRPMFRNISWGLMLFCVFVVTLSVERGPLFGTMLGVILAFRKSLKRGFMPLFVLAIIVGVISFTGVFERAMSNYVQRGFEDTGREILWPEAIERISVAPFFGEGQSNAVIRLGDKIVPPHNSFLYFGLSSGFIPLLFFVAFWVRATWRTVFHATRHINDSYTLPFLAYMLTSLMLVDLSFMSLGGTLISSLVASVGLSRRRQQAITNPIRTDVPSFRGRSSGSATLRTLQSKPR
jgi:O-antigen ligase